MYVGDNTRLVCKPESVPVAEFGQALPCTDTKAVLKYLLLNLVMILFFIFLGCLPAGLLWSDIIFNLNSFSLHLICFYNLLSVIFPSAATHGSCKSSVVALTRCSSTCLQGNLLLPMSLEWAPWSLFICSPPLNSLRGASHLRLPAGTPCRCPSDLGSSAAPNAPTAPYFAPYFCSACRADLGG